MSKDLAGRIAASLAEQLVLDLGIKSLPVDPFEIAKTHDIMVVAKPSSMGGVSGFLTKLGDNFVIAHASHIKNDGFIRFTVAHELGHYFLPDHPEKLFGGKDGIHHSRSGFMSDDICEVEADSFAAALLMPEFMFRDAIRDSGEGFPAIEALAKKCRTSITATAIRFAQFAEDPVAVFVSSGQYIDYCFMSPPLEDLPNIRYAKKKGTRLPPRSETFDFNKDSENVTGGVSAEGWTTFDQWIDGAPSLEMKEDVIGLGTYGKTLTVLFRDQPVDEDEEDSDDDD